MKTNKILFLVMIVFCISLLSKNLNADRMTGGQVTNTESLDETIKGIKSTYDDLNRQPNQDIVANNKQMIKDIIDSSKSYKLNNNSENIIGKWNKSSKGWWFGSSSKNYIKGWKKIKGTWYWFNKNGYVNTHIGWEKSKGKWIYSRGVYGYYSDVPRFITSTWYWFDKNGYAIKLV